MAATIDEILDDLNSYSDYEEVGSVERARKWITAAKRYLQMPANQSDQGSALGYDFASMRAELANARAFVASNTSNTGAGTRFFSAAEGFRG